MGKLWTGTEYTDCKHRITLPHPKGRTCDTCGDVLRWTGTKYVKVPSRITGQTSDRTNGPQGHPPPQSKKEGESKNG
jgi:hypothetical protein